MTRDQERVVGTPQGEKRRERILLLHQSNLCVSYRLGQWRKDFPDQQSVNGGRERKEEGTYLFYLGGGPSEEKKEKT